MTSTVCAATFFVSRLDPARGVNLALRCGVTTSSRHQLSSDFGRLVDGDPWDTSHGVTTREEDGSWILLDLRAERTVSRLVLYNCLDCEMDRNLPLAVELSHDGRNFVQVERRDQPIELWDQPIRPQRARFVRLHRIGRGFLRLREVEVH
jgi:hypothetical protein